MQEFARQPPSSSLPATLPASPLSSCGRKINQSDHIIKKCDYFASSKDLIVQRLSKDSKSFSINHKHIPPQTNQSSQHGIIQFTSWRDHANQFSSWGTSGTASPSQSWISSWSLKGKAINCIIGDQILQITLQIQHIKHYKSSISNITNHHPSHLSSSWALLS